MALVTFDDEALHQEYFNSHSQVPGVTTINGIMGMNKKALMGWAARMGREGKDYKKVVTKACNIGSCGHFMIECDLKGDIPDLGNFTANDIEAATRAYEAFCEWRDQFKSFKFIYSELPIVSELFDVGGTEDLIVEINKNLCLIDFKTSSDIWPDHKIQVGTYKNIHEEVFNCELDNNGVPVDPLHKGPLKSAYNLIYDRDKDTFKYLHGKKFDQVWILKVSKEDGSFKAHRLEDKEIEMGWEIFKHTHEVYWLAKDMKWYY